MFGFDLVRLACRQVAVGLLVIVLAGCAASVEPTESFSADSSDGLVVVGMKFHLLPRQMPGVALAFQQVEREADRFVQDYAIVAQPKYCAESGPCEKGYYFGVYRARPGNYMMTDLRVLSGKTWHIKSFVGVDRGILGDKQVDLSGKPSTKGTPMYEVRPGEITYFGTFWINPHASNSINDITVDNDVVVPFVRKFPNFRAPLVFRRPTINKPQS